MTARSDPEQVEKEWKRILNQACQEPGVAQVLELHERIERAVGASALQERLRQIGAELDRLEQAIAANPSPALISMTRSVRDHYERLEEEFLREADGPEPHHGLQVH